MPDWSDRLEIQKEAGIFVKFMHALLGLYVYEIFISLDFEWDFISGKKKFRWPMIFYFANRYLLLGAMIGIAVSFDTTTKLDCQTMYTFNQLAGDAAVGLASVNLSIRTMAIWKQNRWVVGGLIIAILGHWSLILQGVQLTVVWVDGVGCQIIKTNNKILAAIFIYSMCLDLTVLLLTTYKLAGGTRSARGNAVGASRLGRLIFHDGLIFFIIAFLANLIATVFMVLDLNSIMSVIFNVPAAVASTVVATRAVRRLTKFSNNGAEVYPQTTSSGNRGMVSAAATRGMPTVNYMPGVQVQMETFTRQEDINNEIFSPISKAESDTDVEGDVERKGGSL